MTHQLFQFQELAITFAASPYSALSKNKKKIKRSKENKDIY